MADGSLVFDTKIDSAGFSGGLKRLGVMGVKATAAVTAGLAAVSGYAVKVGASFEAGMSEVGAISGATQKDIARLADKAKEMGATTKFSATESAEALKYMAMAGWDTEKMMSGLPGVMKLAAASGEELGLVSDIVTDSMTAFGLKADQAGHFADVLAMASSGSNTNVAMLGESFKYVAPLAGALGYSAEDTAVALGLMANAGIKSSQAGTSLRSALSRLAKPTDQMQVAMAELGLSLTDSSGKMKPLSILMDEMRGSMQGLSEEQQAYFVSTLFGKEAMAGMLSIINATDEDYQKLTNSINNATGAADRMEKEMMDNLKGDFQILKSTTEALGISLYETFDTQLRGVTQKATGYISELINATKGTNQIRKEMLATGMSIHDVNEAMAGMEFNPGGFEGLAKSLGGIVSNVLKDIASVAPKVIELAVSIITSLIQGISDNLPQLINSAIQIVATLGQGLMTALPMLAQLLFDGLTNIFNAISDNSDAVVGGIGRFVVTMAELIIANLPTLLSAGIKMIVSLGKSIIGYLPQIIDIAPRLINDFANAIYSQIPTLLKGAWDLMSALAVGLVKAIPVIIKNLPQIIMAIVNVITLFNWASVGKSIIQGLSNGMTSLTGWLKANAGNIIKSVGGGFLTLIKSLPTIAKSIISALANRLKGNSRIVLQTVKNIALGMIKSFVKMLPKFASVGKDIVKGIISGIGKSAGLLISKMTELAKSAWSAVKNFFGIKSPSRLMRDTIGKPIVQGIAVGINAEQQALNDSIIEMSDEALRIAKEKAGNYKEIGKIYSEKMAKGIEKSANQSIDAVKKLIESTIPEANKNNKKAVAEYKKAGKEVATAYAKSIKDGISKVKEEISAEVEKITQEAQKQYDSVIAKQQEMEQKLAGFGDLFVIDDENQQATLENINDQISAIKRYDEVLTSLRDKGAGDAFLGEVTKLGVKEGTKFGEALLKLSDAQFKTYQSNWEEKQKLAKEVAMKFYKDQLDAIQSDFVNRLDSTLKTVPATVKSVGVNAIEGMIVGMDSRKQGAVSKAREIADAVISEMQRAMDIHSPSRVMRDLIGKNIVRGVEEGITDEQHNMLNRMRSAVESAKGEFAAIATARTNNAGGKQIITNNDNGVQQTVNFYQPVKSAVENAREMKRAAKEMAYGY